MGNQALLKANVLAGDSIWLWHEKQIMNSLVCIIIYLVLAPWTPPVTSQHSVCCMHRRQNCSASLSRNHGPPKVIIFICLPNPFYWQLQFKLQKAGTTLPPWSDEVSDNPAEHTAAPVQLNFHSLYLKSCCQDAYTQTRVKEPLTAVSVESWLSFHASDAPSLLL